MSKELLGLIIHELQISDPTTYRSLLTNILREGVQPAFAASRPKTITEAGRKTLNPHPQAITARDDEQQLKPWKFERQYGTDLLFWVLEQINVSRILSSYIQLTVYRKHHSKRIGTF
jgi:hypothetical protein